MQHLAAADLPKWPVMRPLSVSGHQAGPDKNGAVIIMRN
jgi:hypothetical protein